MDIKKILLVNPITPFSYWGFQFSNWFLGAEAAHIPLGLITLAALLPKHWEFKLVDMNVEPLTDADIAWADAVMVTGMIVQRQGIETVLIACRGRKLTIVGGPFASVTPDAAELAFAGSVFIGEAEDGVLNRLVTDLQTGDIKGRYVAGNIKPDLRVSPTPRYDLLKTGAYVAMAIQTSRGCPHLCKFCMVRKLFGKRPRYKAPRQIQAELRAIHDTGFRGNVFFVDDNLIADPRAANDILEAVLGWQEENGFSFLFYTQTDVKIAKEKNRALAELMVKAGFYAVFVGIESPSAESLAEAGKDQNVGIDIVPAVRRLHQLGLIVYGGYIIGFDKDKASAFDELYRLVKDSGVSFAMAGMLTALRGTDLFEELSAAGRITAETEGDPFVLPNFIPKMGLRRILDGYRKLIARLYDPVEFFARALVEIAEWKQGRRRRNRWCEYRAALRSIWRQGLCSSYRRQYWRFIVKFIFTGKLGRAFATAICFYHFHAYTQRVVLPRLEAEPNSTREQAA